MHQLSGVETSTMHACMHQLSGVEQNG